MALKRRFAEKTDALVVPPIASAPAAAALRAPATGPGQMLAFREQMDNAEAKVAELEARLKSLDGTIPTLRLDPAAIRPSVWANRHAKSFETGEFRSLVEDIRVAGGNVQAIKVRRAPERDGTAYEVVFGLRRHRACLELGIPVLATIVEADDATLFAEMDRENRLRADLSPYEQGVQYKLALERKLWPSARKMAEALGVSPGLISQALVLADLPQVVVDAFASPLEVQYRWGRALTERLQTDPDGVLSRAGALVKSRSTMSPAEVFRSLMASPTADRKATVREVLVGGAPVARISADASGVAVKFDKRAASETDLEALERLVKAFLEQRGQPSV